jgi:uncharacterized protein YidB (DUF937 family)
MPPASARVLLGRAALNQRLKTYLLSRGASYLPDREVISMGLLQSLEGLAGQSGNNTTARLTNGLMQTLDDHPRGLAGILEQFRQNGMDEHVQNWASGQQTQATPEQMQQGLGSGFIEKVATRAGVSPDTARVALATILPLVVSHFTRGGQQPAPQSGFSGMASQIVGKLL